MLFQFRFRQSCFALLIGVPAIMLHPASVSAAGNKISRIDQRDSLPPKNQAQRDEVRKETDRSDFEMDRKELDRAMDRVKERLERIDREQIMEQVEIAMDRAGKELRERNLDLEDLQQRIDRSVTRSDIRKIKEKTALAMQHARENIDSKRVEELIQRSLNKARIEMQIEKMRDQLERLYNTYE